MKIRSPNYVKLLIEKKDGTEHALISKEKVTTTEKARMNSLVRDLQQHFLKTKRIWVNPCGNGGLTNINVLKYFISDHKELKLYEARRNNVYYKLKLFDSSVDTLRFNKEQITQKTANKYIKKWCQEFDKGLGTEKNLSRDSFYYINNLGGYSVCDNSSGDCFCEDFKTEEEARKYLDGWNLEEIQFGEREHKSFPKLKAYKVGTEDHEEGDRLIFAESANKAKSWCIKHNLFECCYIEMHSIRVPEADKYLDISVKNELNWGIPSHQNILMQKFGWQECC